MLPVKTVFTICTKTGIKFATADCIAGNIADAIPPIVVPNVVKTGTNELPIIAASAWICGPKF
ncbi:hypothetical protein E5259_19135 [Blautia producta]|uniref:Uncharacterized protein n=1 Tax=Blautia producta TaxID=33035 RepID=A0A7G5MY58_9FIRM|nr:hypothetical protein [Blautia producta]QMW79551.1 hypothetical protein E5259_19135 [Blautia producta]